MSASASAGLEHFEHFVHLERRRGENKSDMAAKRLLLLDMVVVCGGGMCGRQEGREAGRALQMHFPYRSPITISDKSGGR